MSDIVNPFCFSIHGDADGRVNSFYYGMDMKELITLLETVLKDYKQTYEEASKIKLSFKDEIKMDFNHE